MKAKNEDKSEFLVRVDETNSFFTLYWDKIEGAEGYRIYRKNENGLFCGVDNAEATSRPSYNLDKTKFDGAFLKVKPFRTVDGKQTFFASSEVFQTVCNRMNVTVTTNPTTAVFLWEPVENADGYRIFSRGRNGVFTGIGDYFKPYAVMRHIRTSEAEFKIKAFRDFNGERSYFLSTPVISVVMPVAEKIALDIALVDGKTHLSWDPDNSEVTTFTVYKNVNNSGFTEILTNATGTADFDYIPSEKASYIVEAECTDTSGNRYTLSSNVAYADFEGDYPVLMSVIIPCYNCEKFINNTVRNILRSTLYSLEVILVDDGSKDSTKAKIKQLVSKYDKVHAVYKKNGGAGSARNAGVAAARGKYVGFVDSDDSVSADMYETLYKRAFYEDSDIAFSLFWKSVNNCDEGVFGGLQLDPEKVHSSEEILSVLYARCTVWNRIYRSDIVKKVKFPHINFEDVAWTPVVFSYANRFSFCPYPLYKWCRHSDSTEMTLFKNADRDILFEKRKLVFEFIESESNPEHHEVVEYVLAFRIAHYLGANKYSNKLYYSELRKRADSFLKNPRILADKILTEKIRRSLTVD